MQPLIEAFKAGFIDHEDTRREYSTTYTFLDAALSGLACMFYKCGTLVRFQEGMKHKHFKNNLETQ